MNLNPSMAPQLDPPINEPDDSLMMLNWTTYMKSEVKHSLSNVI